MNALSGNPVAYGRTNLAGQIDKAYRFYDTVTLTDPNGSPSPFINSYTPGRKFSISSYAPTSAGDPNILNQTIKLTNVRVNVTEPLNSYSTPITIKFNQTPLPFLPLYKVTGIIGLSGQIGRPTTIEASIRKTDPENKSSNAHIIHGLSLVTTVGSVANIASTFQDIIAPGSDCFAYLPSGGSYA
jgi:hypothetical protein